MDIGSFVVEIEFLSPLFTGLVGLGGVGYYYRYVGKIVSTYRVWDRQNAMHANIEVRLYGDRPQHPGCPDTSLKQPLGRSLPLSCSCSSSQQSLKTGILRLSSSQNRACSHNLHLLYIILLYILLLLRTTPLE